MFCEVCGRNRTKKVKGEKKAAHGFSETVDDIKFHHLSAQIRPCCSPLVWIHCDGPRLTQLSGDQNFPLPAISRGNRDALVARVSPVDVLVDPVDSQSFRGVQRVNERHLLRRIAGLVDVSAGGKRRKPLSVLFDLCHQKQSHHGDPS